MSPRLDDDVEARVARALARRRHLPFDALRLVAAEADGLAGVVVDRYAHVARIETSGREAARQAARVAPLVVDELRRRDPRAAPTVLHVARDRRGKGALTPLVGRAPAAHVIDEGGRRYLVRTADASALGTGLFFDQREGRALVEAHARGGPALNLFAHAGGFTVAAARGGATRVDHVDMSKKCARWGAVNLALNGVNPREHRFVVDDALVFLARAAKKRARYRVVVCDPPTTALRPDGARMVARDVLARLADDALAVLDDQGLLVFSCNDRALRDDDLAHIVRAAAARARRTVDALSPLPFDDDVLPLGDRALASTRAVVAVLA